MVTACTSMFSQQHHPWPPRYANPRLHSLGTDPLRTGGDTVVMTESDWRCQDCGVDTHAIAEYYMVTDGVWKQAANGVDGRRASDVLNSGSAARATSPIASSTRPAIYPAAHG